MCGEKDREEGGGMDAWQGSTWHGGIERIGCRWHGLGSDRVGMDTHAMAGTRMGLSRTGLGRFGLAWFVREAGVWRRGEVWRLKRHGSMEGRGLLTADMLVLTQECTTGMAAQVGCEEGLEVS